MVLAILKDYFHRQHEDEEADAYDRAKAYAVLVGLRMARKLIGSDESNEVFVAEVLGNGPPTAAQMTKAEEFDAAMKAQGKEHWWDD